MRVLIRVALMAFALAAVLAFYEGGSAFAACSKQGCQEIEGHGKGAAKACPQPCYIYSSDSAGQNKLKTSTGCGDLALAGTTFCNDPNQGKANCPGAANPNMYQLSCTVGTYPGGCNCSLSCLTGGANVGDEQEASCSGWNPSTLTKANLKSAVCKTPNSGINCPP